MSKPQNLPKPPAKRETTSVTRSTTEVSAYFKGPQGGREMRGNADYSTWLTIPQVIERTGFSLRTVERKLQSQAVETAKRPEPGKRPITVINPEDLPKLTAHALKPVREPAMSTRRDMPLPVNLLTRQSDIRDVLAALVGLRVPLSQKLFLDRREAAEYTGLPQAEIKRLVKEGVIPSFKVSGRLWRIVRKDLERYNPTTRQMTDY